MAGRYSGQGPEFGAQAWLREAEPCLTKGDVTGMSSTTIGEWSPRGIGNKCGHKGMPPPTHQTGCSQGRTALSRNKGSGSNLDMWSTGLPSQSSQEHCDLCSGHFRGEPTSLGRHSRIYNTNTSLWIVHIWKRVQWKDFGLSQPIGDLVTKDDVRS